MKLLIISSEFPPGPGGIGTHASQLARHLCELGWQVAVVTPQDYVSNEEIAAFNTQQPYQIVRLKPIPGAPLEAIYRAITLLRAARILKPDTILATGDRALWIAAVVRQLYRVPLIAVGHGTEFGLRGWQHRLNRWSINQTDHVVCVSEFTKHYMLSRGITPRQVTVIPNGADDSRFQTLGTEPIRSFRQRWEGQYLLLTVGNVTERKGQQVVIRALPKVLATCPNTQYLIVGLPTLKNAYERLATELGVADHVHFLGRVDSNTLLAAYNACDIFLMTSVHTDSGDFEGYGIAAVEAAFCGKPSVVSGDSGLAEAVIDQHTGMVVPQNAPEQTAEAIITLLTNPEKRGAMGHAARERAFREQTWTRRIAEYHQLLMRLTGNP